MEPFALRDTPLLSHLSKSAVADIEKDARLLEIGRRSVLFKPGDPAAGIYVLASGAIKLALRSHRAGAEKVFAILRPGEAFGAAALILRAPHVTIAAAVRDSLVWHLPKDKALRALRCHPQLAVQLAAEVSRRLRAVLLDVHRTATLSAAQRAAIFLLEEVPTGKRGRAIAMPLPAAKAEIASKLGLTPAHFSRILHHLASDGLLDVRASTITINDVKRLRSMANASLPRRHWF